MPRPTFTVMWRVEKPVYHPLVSVGSRVRQKTLHLVGRGGQPRQVERHSIQQCRPIGRGGHPQAARPQTGQHERIHRGHNQVGLGLSQRLFGRSHDPRQLRDAGTDKGLKGPPRPLFGCDVHSRGEPFWFHPVGGRTGGNPRFHHRQFFGRNLLGKRRHFARPHAFDQQAFGGFAHLDRRTAFPPLNRQPPQSQIEPARQFLFSTMTVETVGFEDGAHIPFKRRGSPQHLRRSPSGQLPNSQQAGNRTNDRDATRQGTRPDCLATRNGATSARHGINPGGRANPGGGEVRRGRIGMNRRG